MNQPALIDVPAYCGVDDDNQRFTSREALAWCKSLTGVHEYDLDVAACPESHHAPIWFGRQLDGTFCDGLGMSWWGHVFCNPPWDDIGPWVDGAWQAFREGRVSVVAMLLPGNRTHRPWWQELVEPLRDGRGEALRRAGRLNPVASLEVHFAPKRFAYGGPGNPLAIGVGEPNFTSVALVWRRAP